MTPVVPTLSALLVWGRLPVASPTHPIRCRPELSHPAKSSAAVETAASTGKVAVLRYRNQTIFWNRIRVKFIAE